MARSAASEESEAVDRRPPPPAERVARRAVLRPRSAVMVGAPDDVNPAPVARPLPRVVLGPAEVEETATLEVAPDQAAAPQPAAAPSEGITAPSAQPAAAPSGATPTTGPRHRRRLSRRRRTIEQVLLVLIFAVALGVTVLLLVSQWLLNASVTGAIRGAGLGTVLPLPTVTST